MCKLIKKFSEVKTQKIVEDSVSKKVLFVGDIHGDLDTVNKVKMLISKFDKVVFLGDYVDRGNQGVEVLTEILKLVFKYKGKIVLLKGNHENVRMNMYYGFYEEVMRKCLKIWKVIEDFYRNLSLIYINRCIKVFAVHGGIGRVVDNLGDLVEDEESLLWSDFNWNNPYLTERNNYRGVGLLFGLDVLKPFMDKFGFKYFVRSHEYFEEGCRIFKFDEKLFITVFSSNADGYFFVKKKALKIDKKEAKVIRFA